MGPASQGKPAEKSGNMLRVKKRTATTKQSSAAAGGKEPPFAKSSQNILAPTHAGKMLRYLPPAANLNAPQRKRNPSAAAKRSKRPIAPGGRLSALNGRLSPAQVLMRTLIPAASIRP